MPTYGFTYSICHFLGWILICDDKVVLMHGEETFGRMSVLALTASIGLSYYIPYQWSKYAADDVNESK